MSFPAEKRARIALDASPGAADASSDTMAELAALRVEAATTYRNTMARIAALEEREVVRRAPRVPALPPSPPETLYTGVFDEMRAWTAAHGSASFADVERVFPAAAEKRREACEWLSLHDATKASGPFEKTSTSTDSNVSAVTTDGDSDEDVIHTDPHTCAICVEPKFATDSVKLECGHDYHETCFKGWTEVSSKGKRTVSCPLCRHPTRKPPRPPPVRKRVEVDGRADFVETWTYTSSGRKSGMGRPMYVPRPWVQKPSQMPDDYYLEDDEDAEE